MIVIHVVFYQTMFSRSRCRLKFAIMFNRNRNFFFHFFPKRIYLMELFFNFFENITFKILFSAVFALKARHIVDDEKSVAVFVNILYLAVSEILVSAKMAHFTHFQPRSYGFLNLGGVGTYTVMIATSPSNSPHTICRGFPEFVKPTTRQLLPLPSYSYCSKILPFSNASQTSAMVRLSFCRSCSPCRVK